METTGPGARESGSQDDTSEEGPTSAGRRAFGRRELALTVVLGAVVLALGLSGVGMVPVPNSTGNATLLHLPVVAGGVVGGPYVGLLTGLVFGLFSWANHAAPIFRDPLVAVVPRLFIGLVAWWVFLRLASRGRTLAAAAAGALGSAANTVGVLSVAIGLGHIPASVALAVLPQAAIEAGLAALVALACAWLWPFRREGRPEGSGTSREKE